MRCFQPDYGKYAASLIGEDYTVYNDLTSCLHEDTKKC